MSGGVAWRTKERKLFGVVKKSILEVDRGIMAASSQDRNGWFIVVSHPCEVKSIRLDLLSQREISQYNTETYRYTHSNIQT